jgi:5-methylcytosine-specific restriction endonuclease McrA
MSGKSAISWSAQTAIVDRGGRRTRFYARKCPDIPGARLRRDQAAAGLAWCRDCRSWLKVDFVSRGRCRPHHAAADRARYASHAGYRAERRSHAYRRKFGVDPVPPKGKELLSDIFEGECSYCNNPAETWDHVIPVSKGGLTREDNILPACVICNSSKKDRDLLEWLDATGRTLKLIAAERLAHFQVLDL